MKCEIFLTLSFPLPPPLSFPLPSKLSYSILSYQLLSTSSVSVSVFAVEDIVSPRGLIRQEREEQNSPCYLTLSTTLHSVYREAEETYCDVTFVPVRSNQRLGWNTPLWRANITAPLREAENRAEQCSAVTQNKNRTFLDNHMISCPYRE